MGKIVVKIGGVASDNLTNNFFEQIESWQAHGHEIIIVHGGGYYITEMMERLNIPVMINKGYSNGSDGSGAADDYNVIPTARFWNDWS